MSTKNEIGIYTNATTRIFTIFVDVVAALNIFIFFIGLISIIFTTYNGITDIQTAVNYVSLYIVFFIVFGAFTMAVSAYNKLSYLVEIKKIEKKDVELKGTFSKVTERIEPSI